MVKKNNIITSITIIILVLLITLSLYLLTLSDTNQDLSENTVTRIIDGDTFELASGDIIRLICVDTPEEGEENYEEASDFLFNLIYNQEVTLENDTDDKDAYGRLLRYVYVNDTFINKEIVSHGYGTLFPYGNNTAKCDEIESS